MSSANFAGQFVTGYGYLSTGADYPSPDYELSSHTRGLQLQAADQLNAQNLLTFTVTIPLPTSHVGITSDAAPPSVTNLVGANGQCYNYTSGAQSNCLLSSTAGSYSNPTPSSWTGGSACANLPRIRRLVRLTPASSSPCRKATVR